MILGNIIRRLEVGNPKQKVKMGFGKPHSYRGDYACLAFEPTLNTTVGEMLEAAKEAVGETYIGWKGGSFIMDKNTDVYLSYIGECGEEIGPILLDYMLGRY